MATNKSVQGKRSLEEMSSSASDDDDEEEDEEYTNKKGKKISGLLPGSQRSLPISCQAEDCSRDLSNAKAYHRRHKVCEFHAKASIVFLAGLRQRFCQQCSRFHELSEFDDTKRSCRRRLAGHNERRRKSSSEHHGEGSTS